MARPLLAELVGRKQNCGGLDRGLEPSTSPIADARVGTAPLSHGGCNLRNAPGESPTNAKVRFRRGSRRLPPAQPPR